ncbi:adhesion G protein-coupled receptor A3-like [Anneissia japonica]|uniref:adhesion G protein-coupled receptor A3-like n=1 Tax=Anneissia japonica TaxID=1529436 RepID=UPI0014256E0E|nr:adhesion G protein-coupled receptor A3-like [Anneissia japonica]
MLVCRQNFRMTISHGLLVVLTIIVVELIASAGSVCPKVCTCKKRTKSDERGNKDVSCSSQTSVPDGLPTSTYKLDLSNNDITILKRGDFDRLGQIRKLDLSNNRISIIEPDAFLPLGKLKKLDLSNNNLRTIINSSLFNGLDSLEKLNLSFNLISRFPENCFNSVNLPKLKSLDFQSPYVLCDCNMTWLLKWKQEENVKISNTTVCEYPVSYHKDEVDSLNRKVLNCSTFVWGKTVAGFTVRVHCPFGSDAGQKYGSRMCDFNGKWQAVDTSQCVYVDRTTRSLQRLAQRPCASTDQALLIARDLEIQTSDAGSFTDKVNIIFVAEALEKVVEYTSQELGRIMINIGSNIMEVNENVLKAAQVSKKACSRIVLSLERFASSTSTQSLEHSSSNILFKSFNVTTPGFWGMTCVAVKLQAPRAYGEDIEMLCNTANKTVKEFNGKTKKVEAAIQLPANIFRGLSAGNADISQSKYTLYVFFYRNGRLFPTQGNSSNLISDEAGTRFVGSYVISSKIAGHVVSNLSDPVVLTFHTKQGIEPIAAYWNFSALGSQGAWSSEGCSVVKSTKNQSVVHCNHMTNYAVLLDVSVKDVVDSMWWNDGFLHPAIYLGSFICFLLVLFNLITYIIFCSKIRMKKRCLHAVINISLGILLLLIFFAGGINRSATPLVCQIVGIGLHYTTIGTLLWIGISIRNIMKSLSRKRRMVTLGENPLPPRPIIRFYFIGWGIPIIVVGITAAVNLENYGGPDVCWLKFKVSLLAFSFVVVFILLVQFVFIIMASLRIQRLPSSHKYDARIPSLHFTPDQTQITTTSEQISQTKDSVRTVETEQPFLNDSESIATHHTTAASVISSVLDHEHSYQKQLRGMVLLLFLYILTWVSGALAISQKGFFYSIFSYVNGLMVIILGLYIIIFFCFMRNDVKYCWKVAFGCQKRRAFDPQMAMLSSVTANGNANGVCRRQSTSSLDSTFTNRSSNTNNPSFKSGSRRTTSKCNYVPAHTITDMSLQEDNSVRETPILTGPDMRSNGQLYNRYQLHQKRSRPKHYKYARYSQLSRDSSDNAHDHAQQQQQIVWGGFHDSLSSAPESRMSALEESRDEMEARANYTTGDASTLERSGHAFMLPQAYARHNGHSSLPKMIHSNSDLSHVRRKSPLGPEEGHVKRQSSRDDFKKAAVQRNTSRESLGQRSSKATTPDVGTSGYGISSYSSNATVQEMHPLSKHLVETDDHKLGGNIVETEPAKEKTGEEVFMITKEVNGFSLKSNGHTNKETSV